ncbi:MAG: serine hydrolase [Gemmatimonadota bacterium]
MKRHRGRIGAAFLAMTLGLPPAGLLAQSASGSSAPLTLQPDSVVQALMEARIKLLPYSGMVVGLIDANGERTLSAGTLNGPGTPAPGAGTLFEIGSVTKTFTATLLADMVSRGEVQLDEPVSELLPDSVQVPQRDGKRITLLDLATQSSGLPRLPTNMHPANMEDPYADYSVAQLYSFLSSYDLPRDPGAKYEYSNLGVGLLGFALARQADTSYEGLVRTRIAEPLDMPDTRIDLTTAEHGRLAPGHNAAGDTVANWSAPTLAGAGALRSTLHDMMRYLAANLRADTTTALGRDMRTAHMPRRPTDIPATRIGLVWMVRDTNATRVIWHNGGTGGYHAFIGFDPTRHMGVVMLINNTRGADDIGLHLLDPSVAISPPPPPPPHRTAMALTPAQLQPYVGRYAIAPGAILTVTLRQDQLFVQLTGQSPLPIYAESDGHFFLKVVDATLDFVRDDKGNVTAAVLHQNGRDVTAQRMQGGS